MQNARTVSLPLIAKAEAEAIPKTFRVELELEDDAGCDIV
jgi:hypothetical protein